MDGIAQGTAGAPRHSRDMVGRGAYRPRPQMQSFDPATTALLVLDPVNDFLSEGGAGWEMTKATVKAHDVIGHLREAVAAARRKGIPVLYGPMAYTQEDYADGKLQCRCWCCAAGTGRTGRDRGLRPAVRCRFFGGGARRMGRDASPGPLGVHRQHAAAARSRVGISPVLQMLVLPPIVFKFSAWWLAARRGKA